MVETFLRRICADAPTSASVETVIATVVPALNDAGFSIEQSAESGQRALVVPPDLATCADCRHELADPNDRRFRYPFLTCTQCGPRYSLLTAIPYERSNTTMAKFELCAACRAEYSTESDRRFMRNRSPVLPVVRGCVCGTSKDMRSQAASRPCVRWRNYSELGRSLR